MFINYIYSIFVPIYTKVHYNGHDTSIGLNSSLLVSVMYPTKSSTNADVYDLLKLCSKKDLKYTD